MEKSENTRVFNDEGNFDLLGFLYEIDWTEGWIIGLVIWHVMMFLVSYRARHKINIQCALFLALSTLVYFSEQINELAANNWRLFSKQQYFDKQGMFISVLFSMPILLNCLMIVVNWLMHTNGALSQLIRHRGRNMND